LLLTWWHIAEVAAFQHIINASNDRKNTLFFIPRGKAAILAICSLVAGDFLRDSFIFKLLLTLQSCKSIFILGSFVREAIPRPEGWRVFCREIAKNVPARLAPLHCPTKDKSAHNNLTI